MSLLRKKDKKREGSSTSRPKSGRTSSAKGSLSVKSSSSKHDKKGGRSKSRTSCQDDTEEDTSSQPIEPSVEEHYDFIGYNVGDKLIHASGSLTTLFPSDGGQIRVDKNSYVQGAKNVRVSVLKDGNVFVLHFVDPVGEILPQEDTEPEGIKIKEENNQESKEKHDDEGIEKSEIEGNEKEQKELSKKFHKGPKPFCDFSSFVAQFNDGMILTHSGYGPSGSIISKELKETEAQLISSIVVPEGGGAAHGTPSPQPKAGSPKSRKKMDEEIKRMEELQQQQEEEKARLEEEAKKREEEEKNKKPFQNLFITCPDGLHLDYFNDGTYLSALDKGGVAVRQRYPIKGLGKQECEKPRQKPAMEEVSRTVLTNGTVIKFMKDDFVQVLFPDGGISSCQSFPTTSTSSRPTSQPTSTIVPKQPEISPTKKGLRATSSQKSSEEPPVPTLNVPEKVAQWVSTGIGGARVRTKEDGEVESLDGVLFSLATCPESGQVLRTREDNVVIVERPDGTLIVEHADGTRITTFYQELQTQTQVPDNETGEEALYKTINGKFVRVECPGFASLTFNCHEGSCGTVFGNGVYMETLANGVTTVERVDGSQLHIDATGVVSFAPRELTGKIDLSIPAPTNQPTDIPAGVYVMRSTQQNCCETKDIRGTHFSVASNGKMSIDKKEPQEVKDDNGATTEKKIESTHIERAVPQTTLVPRYFIIHSDGSGSELLRHADVREFLSRAEKDPATAVLRSPVEGDHEATGVTILKPYAGGISKEWFLQKIEDVIIPGALRERDFTAFPARHEKRPGPVFGTNVGAGVNVGTIIKNKPSIPPITCPPAFEFRQLIEYKRLTDDQRQQIVTCMKEYSEYVTKRQEKLDAILPQDPRDESEKLIAEKLDLKMTAAEKEVKEESDSKDVDSHPEEKEPEPGEEKAEIKDGIKEVIDSMSGKIQGESVGQQYVDAITPAPVPRPPPPRWKRSRSEWERDKIELAELEYGKNALKNHEVPPYFETARGQEFLHRAYDNLPDLDTLTSRLAEQTRHPPPGEGSASETSRSDSGGEELKQKFTQEFCSPEIAQVTNASANNENESSPSANGNTLSPNNLRPTNPTPAHATGDGTPTPLRPNNPTPAHASKPSNPRPSNPTPKHAEGQREELESSNDASPVFEEQQQWRSNLESVREIESTHDEQHDGIVTQSNNSSENSEVITDTPGNPKVGAKSLYMDVTGGVRKDKVKLPTSILSSKPGALLNSQFLETEDPVRRRVHTVSVAGGNKISPGRVEALRGFEMFPPKVSFGVLKEGCTYIHSVIMKNVGIDSCRFKIKQPPLSTGLRVLYNPGPVAAGMNTKLDIEIFAVAVGVVGDSGVGQIGHHVEIVTETDVIYLPVYATIMTAYEYENRYGDQDSGLTNGTNRVPNRPPSRDPTRPRKSVEYALINQETI
ncbi:sperm-associated antigen 17-like isoform X2 [Actinia tenebrosa]|uniref:Sperm-associated antigen 17-like isoform X2 n=1 Tax=Actinia tenebrosa TaxID=6105 RepID=A0A6P8H9G4_ACTTE|nr:sperm-associated antigen 17-like isoform X2 [Actinia tenebrosa]